MKIAIAGYGYVGKAHEAILSDHYDIEIVDPAIAEYADKISKDVDAIIICVSTPMGSHGGCHMDNVYNVIEDAPKVPILIKSTISVEGWRMLRHVFTGHSLTYSPEFLRAESWLQDTQETDHLYLGGGDSGFWTDVFLNALGQISVSVIDAAELVTAKSVRNNFLALKVSFFNQMYDYCTAQGLNYDLVAGVVGDDHRIGHSHTTITHERGFGGHCFPKDVQALIKSGEPVGCELTLMKESLKYNESIRKKS
jgi:UDPglucose 6-dehydrogenase